MPTYEYECQECHQRTEAVQKFTDPPLSVCPLCGGELRKVFSAVGIVFKGSGFYKTDSRGSKSTPSESSGSSSEASPSATKTESATPAAAAAAAPTPTPSAAPSSSSTE